MKKINERTERYDIRDGFFYVVIESENSYEAFIGWRQSFNGLLYGVMSGCDGALKENTSEKVYLDFLEQDAESNIMLFLSENLELADQNPELFPVLLGSSWDWDDDIYRFVRYTPEGREILDINTLEWEKE